MHHSHSTSGATTISDYLPWGSSGTIRLSKVNHNLWNYPCENVPYLRLCHLIIDSATHVLYGFRHWLGVFGCYVTLDPTELRETLIVSTADGRAIEAPMRHNKSTLQQFSEPHLDLCNYPNVHVWHPNCKPSEVESLPACLPASQALPCVSP